MKVFIALLAVAALAAPQPVPLVQLIVNVDAPAVLNPVSIEGPVETAPVVDKPDEIYIPGPVNVVDGVDVEPIVIPEPVVLPPPVLPEVILPEPVVLPEPVLPVVVIPSIPAGIVSPVESGIVSVPVVAASVHDH